MAKFRTRARTVDMLGRQQIAGIPNAISELFKNAHDAFATHVEVDFYRPEGLFVLRDNGLGMTRRDVEERWLTIGTESKVDGGRDIIEVASILGMPSRTPTGEKGIGRLAIATIGPQVLLVTRARRLDGLQSTVAVFINWSLFALPGISLDEIDVPILEFEDGSLPTAEDLSGMVKLVRDNLDQIRCRISEDAAAEIDEQLSMASFDVTSLQRRFETASLGGHSAGTQFFIQPTDTMLEVSLDATPQRRRIGDLQLLLMGFTNTMMPDRQSPPIIAEFRDHRSSDLSESVIGPSEFFTPPEFESADHHFEGDFDEYGQFTGTVSIYGREPEPHTIAWPAAQGRKSNCGPFAIKFAYLQGAPRESSASREEWRRLMSKLDSMGGLYIYRHGIRILPYGNPDFDFINIEQRRTLGARYYFFSYRRIIGAIDLPPESSSRLVEKAGREGFRDNRAYRDFRAILENFFIQLAADYFRDEAARGEIYRETKDELDRQARARERQARQSRVRRREFVSTLNVRAEKLSSDEPKKVVDDTLARLKAELHAAMQVRDLDSQIQLILRAEDAARQRLSSLRNDLRVSQPRGVGLPSALRRDLTVYRSEFARLDKDVIQPAYIEIDAAIRSLRVDVNRRRRFDSGAETAWRSARSLVVENRRYSEEILSDTTQKVSQAFRQATTDFESKFGEISKRLQRTDLTELTDLQVVQLTLDIDAEIESLATDKRNLFESVSQQLESITVSPDESGEIITHLDIMEAAEEELIAVQERAEADLELTQLGMAIDIINHEFQATIRSVRSNLRRLRAWANVNEQLQDVYEGILVNFEHLDGYLTLFTPLHRRLYRSEVEIKGSEIAKFLADLFKDRLSRHEITLEVSREFRRHRFTGYPSTFYPVFVNLLDNAVFWLQDRPAPRLIGLDVERDTMIVHDNGPGINLRDREAVFEMGFSRKPGGRGLGLHISRDVLKRVGYELTVDEPETGQGTLFRIQPQGRINEPQ